MNKFVVVYDEPNQILSNLTRVTPLVPIGGGHRPYLGYDLKWAAQNLPAEYFFIVSDNSSEELLDLEPGLKEHLLRMLGLDITSLDPRCRSTRRLQDLSDGKRMVALELLLFGVGALRRKGHWSSAGSIEPRELQSRDISVEDRCEITGEPTVETWQSTNLIYGDAYGELLQLKARAGDRKLYKTLLEVLCAIKLFQLHLNYGFLLESQHLGRRLTSFHRANGIWTAPPRDLEELKDRIEFLLENCIVDRFPITIIPEVENEEDSPSPKIMETEDFFGPPRDWDTGTGYDGWLADPFDDLDP